MSRAERPRRSALGWIVGGAGLIALALALALNQLADSVIPQFAQRDPSMLADVIGVDFVARSPVVLRGELQRVELYYRGPGGIVTEVAIRPDVPVDAGQLLLRVDGVAAIAWTGTTTFYRPLDVGAEGPDVLALEQALTELGYLAWEVDDYYGTATRDAIEALQVALGERSDGIFRPGYLVRLPRAGLAAVEVFAEQDRRIGDGDVIADLLQLGELALESGREVPTGWYDLRLGELELAAEYTDEGWRVELPEDLPLVALAAAASDTGELALEGVAIGHAATAALSFPPAALVTDATGATCVGVTAEDTTRLVPVRVLGAEVSGAVLVRAGDALAAGETVRLDQSQIGQTCPLR